MTSTPRPEPDGAPLRQRLALLRRRLRLVAIVLGLSWLLTAILATVVLVGLVDRRLHLPGLVRAAALTGLLVGAGTIVHRLLLRPLRTPMDDLSLALRIEERHPTLTDALASTVQFLEREVAPEGESASMRREAVRRTLGKAEGLDFNRVVSTRGLRTASVCSGLSAIVALGLFALAPMVAATALARLALPFSSVDWPKKTRLELDSVARRIGRNKDYSVRGKVSGVIPKEAVVELTYDGFPMQRKTFSIHPDKATFTMHLKPDEVVRNFRFRIVANDARTKEFGVEVLPLPILVAFNGKPSPQVKLEYPAYTDLKSPADLTPGSGNVEAVNGTVVTFRAAADRPLKRAWIEYQPEIRETPVAACLAALGCDSIVGVVTSLALAQLMCEPVQAQLSENRKRFTVRFRPAVHGRYAIHFEDENELENSLGYELRLRPDPAPVVRLDRPSPSRDVLTVLPTAELPLQVMVEDVQFAVRSVHLEYRTQPNEEPRIIPLYHAAKGIGREAAAWAGLGVLAAPVPRLRLQRLEFDRILPIPLLRHANGDRLKEGDAVTIQVIADDFDDVSLGKEPGRSHQVEIRIVTRPELDLVLNTAQTQVQQKLVRLREKERDAISRVAEVESRLRRGGKMTPEREAVEAEAAAQKAVEDAAAEEEKADKATEEAARQQHKENAAEELRAKSQQLAEKATDLKRQATQMAEAEQLQQQIREGIGDHKEGLRAEVERLRETLKQNGLQRSNAMERMTAVGKELDRLAERELDNIEPKLVNARKLADLLDEKTRQERRAELEKRAKEAEKEARASEALAQKLKEQADRAEKAADAADNAQEKARRQEEAGRLRQQVQEQRQRAAERRAQAERDRRDATEKSDPARPRQALAEARRGQEAVEKSLNALLRDTLGPWASTAEIKGEAGRILQEQKELQAQLEALDKKALTGKSTDELSQAEKAELENLQDTQRRLERTAELINKMKDVAAKRADKDAETAKELNEAAKQAEEGNLAGQMKEAGEHIRQNQLEKAKAKQREAVAELEKLVKNLEDRREAELDRIRKKVREAEKKVEELLDEQEKLKQKIREAGKIGDPEKRKEELEKLARKQLELQKKADELMQQLSRLGNERAKQAMGRAGEEMSQARKQLNRGQRDDEKQEDVLDRLEEARQALERQRKNAEEELGREQLARVADAIKRIRERQAGHIEEAKRIQDSVLQRKEWKLRLRSSLGNLGENQKGLGEETALVAKRDLSAAPVFARLLSRAARAMNQAGQRLREMTREPLPELAKLPDQEASRLQKEALRRLDQLLDSLKESQDNPVPLARSQGDEDGDQGEGGGDDDGLPPMAQLKLLLALQKEIKARTEAFTKKHPDPEKLTHKQKAELQDIHREQKEVADLLAQMTRPAGEEPEDEDTPKEKAGEKK